MGIELDEMIKAMDEALKLSRKESLGNPKESEILDGSHKLAGLIGDSITPFVQLLMSFKGLGLGEKELSYIIGGTVASTMLAVGDDIDSVMRMLRLAYKGAEKAIQKADKLMDKK